MGGALSPVGLATMAVGSMLKGGGGGGKSKATVPPPAPPTAAAPEVNKAGEEERIRQARMKGRASTMLTDEEDEKEKVTTARAKLLGSGSTV